MSSSSLFGEGKKVQIIYSWLSRLNTARGYCTSLMTVGPSKVKASKSFFHHMLFTEGTLEAKVKNTWLMKLTHFII